MKTVVVVAEDRVGLLSDISYILGKSNINIEGLTVEVVGKKAVMAFTVKDYWRARMVLEKNKFMVAESESLVVKLPNRSGVLDMLADRLANESISIENLHTLSSDGDGGVFALNVDKPRKAVRIMSDILLSTGLGGY